MNKISIRLFLDETSGFTLMEIVFIIAIIAVLAAIAIPIYLNETTRAKAAGPMEIYGVLKEQIAIEAATNDELLQCTNALVAKGYLESTDVRLDIEPLALDSSDASKGYAAALHVQAKVGTHGVEGVKVAQEFHRELESLQPDKLIPGTAVINDSFVIFPVLLTNYPVCEKGSKPQSPTASGQATSTATPSLADKYKPGAKPTTADLLKMLDNPDIFGGDPSNPADPNVPAILSVASRTGVGVNNDCENVAPNMKILCKFRPKPITCGPKEMLSSTVVSSRSGTHEVSKGCMEYTDCFTKWYQQTSDNTLCTVQDPTTINADYTCHYCCVGKDCNAKMPPDHNTLVHFYGSDMKDVIKSVGSHVWHLGPGGRGTSTVK